MQHPDYPIEFKPAIAAYDWDQTYDILGFSYLPQGFDSLMSLCNIPAYETLAIDRFTPYDYLWAINYSDYLYSFLGYFNYCPFNSISSRTAKDIDSIEIKLNGNVISIDKFNYFNNLSSLTNSSYFITIPKGKVKITWLTNEGSRQGIINEIFTLNQCLVNFNFSQDTQIDLLSIKQDFKINFCANSLLFSQLVNDQWVEFTPQGINNNFLLYSDIQVYFWEIQQVLISYFDFVHNRYGYIIADTNVLQNEKKIVFDAMPLKTYLKTINQNFSFSVAPATDNRLELFNFSQPPLDLFYDYFPYFLSNLFFLQRANNNKWGLGVQIQNEGFFPKPNRFSSFNFLSFNAYNSHVDQNQLTFHKTVKDIADLNLYEDYDIYPTLTPIWSWGYPTDVYDYQYNFFKQNWNWGYVINLNPPKSSIYLWDFPAFDLDQQWKLDNVLFSFNDYSSFQPQDYINDLILRFTPIDALSAPYGLYQNNGNMSLYLNVNSNFSLPIEHRAMKHDWSAATIINSNTNYISIFSFFKKIISSLYKLEFVHIANYEDDPLNPGERLKRTEGVLYKIVKRIPYSLFDIANEELPNYYSTFDYIGGYSGYRPEYIQLPDPFFNGNFIFDENHNNYISFELWAESEYENLYNYGIISDSDYLIYLQNLKIQVENNMVDSVRVKEIHSCLGASEFSYINNNPTTPIYMHMARKLDYIAKALGIAFNGDGSIMGIRQSKALENGETIPAGWNFGQFGRNDGNNTSNNAQPGGNSSEERLGIVYDVRSNKFIKNPASGEEDIKQGGYILCESIPQMLHIMLDDLDRALGLQTLGAIAITNQNYNDNYGGADLSMTTPYYKYNGLGDAFVEVMHTLADTHKQAFQANIGSLKSQAITIEILGALGVGCIEKKIILEVDDQAVKIVYPGFNGITPSIADLQIWTLINQSFLNEVIT